MAAKKPVKKEEAGQKTLTVIVTEDDARRFGRVVDLMRDAFYAARSNRKEGLMLALGQAFEVGRGLSIPIAPRALNDFVAGATATEVRMAAEDRSPLLRRAGVSKHFLRERVLDKGPKPRG